MKPQQVIRLASCHLRQMRDELEAIQLDVRFNVQRERAIGELGCADSTLVALLNDLEWEAKP